MDRGLGSGGLKADPPPLETASADDEDILLVLRTAGLSNNTAPITKGGRQPDRELDNHLTSIYSLCKHVAYQLLRGDDCNKDIQTVQWTLREINTLVEQESDESEQKTEVGVAEALEAPEENELACNLIRVDETWYDVGERIGKGSFGVVFEGRELPNGRLVAIKFVSTFHGIVLRIQYTHHDSRSQR